MADDSGRLNQILTETSFLYGGNADYIDALYAAYEDDPASGKKRHLKRLWLATRRLKSRPPHFGYKTRAHWGETRSMSHVPAVERV